MLPSENIAFLVVHGMGAHRPFETVDAFARGFYDLLKEEDPSLTLQWKHELQRHNNWIENYVSLTIEGGPVIDFYEYYWDCYMVREVTTGEVVEWLDLASTGAQLFYKEFEGGKAREYQEAGIDLFKDGEFEFRGYRRLLVPAFSQIACLAKMGPLISAIPKWGPLIKPVAHFAAKRIAEWLGDLVVYTTSDVRSQNYETRQKMLSGAVEELMMLLENKKYAKVIVAGHSLGSVIAYDALNRICLDASIAGGVSEKVASRFSGFVTIGSPLDKIAFFFQERTQAPNYIQRQILAHFHGYRHIKLPGDESPFPVGDPIKHILDDSKWLNFYHRNDPVSGPLDAYRLDDDENIECCKEDVGIIGAHSHYWTCRKMYRRIAEEFF